MTTRARTRIMVIGAGGLIGHFIAVDMIERGHEVTAVARRLTTAQRQGLCTAALETSIVDLDESALTGLIEQCCPDLVVNCLGILQDAPTERTDDIHRGFVERLCAALRGQSKPAILVHLSIPGHASDDRTPFARTKRNAERSIAQSRLAYVILRPGFVMAPAAYGGSALLRALATLPFDLPEQLASRPLAAVAVEDIAETIAVLAERWQRGDRGQAAVWDLVSPVPTALGDVLWRLRVWLGGPLWHLPLPQAVLVLGAWCGDRAVWLGWRPPVRSTALSELARGVVGDPRPWMQSTGIEPQSLDDVLRRRPATVQEKWFARLYLLKAVMIAALTIFWCASALIVLAVSYPEAVRLLTSRGTADGPAQLMTTVGSVADFSIGAAIAVRRSHRWGLWAGVAMSLFYMVAAAVMTPDLWIEPLGALVKTGPAIALMLVALAMAEDR